MKFLKGWFPYNKKGRSLYDPLIDPEDLPLPDSSRDGNHPDPELTEWLLDRPTSQKNRTCSMSDFVRRLSLGSFLIGFGLSVILCEIGFSGCYRDSATARPMTEPERSERINRMKGELERCGFQIVDDHTNGSAYSATLLSIRPSPPWSKPKMEGVDIVMWVRADCDANGTGRPTNSYYWRFVGLPDADLHETNFQNYMRSLYRKGLGFEASSTNDAGAAYIRSLHGLDLTK